MTVPTSSSTSKKSSSSVDARKESASSSHDPAHDPEGEAPSHTEDAEGARVSLGQIRDALESLTEGFALFDEDDRLILWNEAYLAFWPELRGHLEHMPTFADIAQVVANRGGTLGALIAPDRWVSDRLARHSIAEGGHIQALPDGRWVQVNELRTGSGGIVGIYTDITDVKTQDNRRHTRELTRKNLALQATIENLSEAVCMFDANRQLAAWNKSFASMLKLKRKVKGTIRTHADFLNHCRTVMGMEDRGHLNWRESESAESGEQNWNDAHRVQKEVPAKEKIYSIRNTAMASGGMVFSLSDMTEMIQARRLLEETADVLERRVAERTAKLMAVNQRLEEEIKERRLIQEQLVRAKAEAEEANMSKTRFIASASHDLLQPLNAARLFSAALLEEELPPESHLLADKTNAALDSVEDLLEALFEIARLDARALQVEITDFPLERLFSKLRGEFIPMATASGLDFDLPTTDHWVRSDARLLRRILQNLISNAVKYTHEGRVKISCMPMDGILEIRVEDTGPGIPLEKQDDIFEDFRRLTGENHPPGKGVGLSIVKRASQILGHKVSLRSAPGEGSCFSVHVPLGKASKIPAPPSSDVQDSRTSLKSFYILVVDDEADVRQGMQALLTRWGADILLARDEKGALAAVKTAMEKGRAIDLIISDYRLKGKGTGIELVQKIRARHDPAIPAIIVSADDSAAFHTELEASGFPLIRKPVKPAQLRSMIRAIQSAPRP